jgi:hypothetical protein
MVASSLSLESRCSFSLPARTASSFERMSFEQPLFIGAGSHDLTEILRRTLLVDEDRCEFLN